MHDARKISPTIAVSPVAHTLSLLTLTARPGLFLYMLLDFLQSTALQYMKRFYTQYSCLEHDPHRIMPTAIYVACKVSRATGQGCSDDRKGLDGCSLCMEDLGPFRPALPLAGIGHVQCC